jgi:hypothetical protein
MQFLGVLQNLRMHSAWQWQGTEGTEPVSGWCF